MRLLPVSLAVFYKKTTCLEVWVQTREDDGPYHGLLEFPGGKIEPGESPVAAAVREVEEEVGIRVSPKDARFMGIYPNERSNLTILLYVHLFPEHAELKGKGQWLPVAKETLSTPYVGKIPAPNHRIIDDLFHSLYDGQA